MSNFPGLVQTSHSCHPRLLLLDPLFLAQLSLAFAVTALIPWLVFHLAVTILGLHMLLCFEWLLGQRPADVGPALLSSA